MEKFVILTQSGAKVQAAVGDEDVFRFAQLLNASSEVISFIGESQVAVPERSKLNRPFIYTLYGIAITEELYCKLRSWFKQQPPARVGYTADRVVYLVAACCAVLYDNLTLDAHSDLAEFSFGELKLRMDTGEFIQPGT